MKPATDIPTSIPHDPYQKIVCCLRCEQKLDRYQLMRVSLVPNGHGHGHAILSCPKCGHVIRIASSTNFVFCSMSVITAWRKNRLRFPADIITDGLSLEIPSVETFRLITRVIGNLISE